MLNDLSITPSARAYAKNLKLEMKWRIKRDSGDVTAHDKNYKNYANYMNAVEGNQTGQPDRKKLNEIIQKAMDGGKLTREEKEYLRANDSFTYQRIQSAEREQKLYEQELRRCKSKEEVQRVRMGHLNGTLMTVKSAANNPHISADKKREILATEKLRCDKIETSTRLFIRRGEYAKLPSKAEEIKAAKDTREKRETSSKPDRDPLIRESERHGHDHINAQSPENHGHDNINTQNPENHGHDNIRTESPEERKTRRAKMKAAYACRWNAGNEPAPESTIRARA